MIGWWVDLIQVHDSSLVTGKSLVSIAPLIGKKIEGAGALAQVTTVVPLKFGVSAFDQYLLPTLATSVAKSHGFD